MVNRKWKIVFGKLTCRRSQIKEKTVVRFSPSGRCPKDRGVQKIVNLEKGN
jgi:hypothetical protein